MAVLACRDAAFGIACLIALGCGGGAAPAFAQGSQPGDEVALYQACLAEGSADKNTIRTAEHVLHLCHESTAEQFYLYLDKHGAQRTVDKQRTGTYTYLAIPQGGKCWSKVEDAFEVPTTTFGCTIYAAK